MRTLWCAACGAGYASINGDLPPVCPKCDEPAIWLTDTPSHASKPARDPRLPYALNLNDRRLLKQLRIGEG